MVTVTYTISDAKFQEFKRAFIKAQPVPQDMGGTPIMSENDWIKEWGKRMFLSTYQNGKAQLEDTTNLLE